MIYLKCHNDDETELYVKCIVAKGKVGPINANAIPRLELCGALMLARKAF